MMDKDIIRLWDKILSFRVGERVKIRSPFHKGHKGTITYVNKCLNRDFFLVKIDKCRYSCYYLAVELTHF